VPKMGHKLRILAHFYFDAASFDTCVGEVRGLPIGYGIGETVSLFHLADWINGRSPGPIVTLSARVPTSLHSTKNDLGGIFDPNDWSLALGGLLLERVSRDHESCGQS
jgi:hypothetical protein